MTFKKLLIANRGEIAVRVIRTAHALGYPCVAVYSDADAGSPHVALADEAVRIGPAPVRDSYLNGEALLEAAAKTGADAVHPGYGFLSENAGFAAACAWAGLTFVGPPAEAIELMGNKARAKDRMRQAGVPTVPGYDGEAQDDAALVAAARELGYPLLIKAASGGGGRGMRRVNEEATLVRSIASARAEAENAFGSSRLLMERLVTGARHVEVQVIADQHGSALHLGERDCSTQRRYQKVIEEGPSPAVGPELRARMGQAAVTAALSAGYQGAGTCEFLVDDRGHFFFLEMNTRIQVEHPVTELITGLDLIALQLRVAAGQPLPLRQEDVRLTGHAIEVRLYAEDPWAGHLPQTGRVLAWDPPAGPGVRCDHALRSGQEITPHYDPMIAKVMAHGADREEARRKLILALRDTVALGLRNNKRFLLDLLAHPTFVDGAVTTGFLEALERDGGLEQPRATSRAQALAGALWALGDAPRRAATRERLDGWRSAGPGEHPLALTLDGQPLLLHARVTADDQVVVRTPSGTTTCRVLARDGPRLRADVDGVQTKAHAVWDGGRLHLDVDGVAHVIAAQVHGAREAQGGDGTLRAPASGRVVAVEVAAGQHVERGRTALRIESMKIESLVVVDVTGVVAEVRVSAGAQVAAGQVLVVVTPAPSPSPQEIAT